MTANCAAPRATAWSSAARLRPSTVTVAPARDNVAAISRPIPRPPPVTSACEERDSSDMRQFPYPLFEAIYFKLKIFARKAGNRFAYGDGLLNWRTKSGGDVVSNLNSLTTKDGRFGYEA